MHAIALAFLNGVVQTAFAEELLFRGLIAGSLSRHLSSGWANFAQAFLLFSSAFGDSAFRARAVGNPSSRVRGCACVGLDTD